jgi:hypothetical protein
MSESTSESMSESMSDTSPDPLPATDTGSDTGAIQTKPRNRRDVTRKGDTRRFREKALRLIADMGGADNLNEGQLWLVRTATQISLECEALEAERAAGKEIDLKEYGMMSDRLGRTLARLGLEPEPRSSSPLVGVTVTTSIVNADGTPFERDPHEPITHIQHVIVTPAYAESAVIEQPQLAAALPHVPPPPARIEPVVPIAQPWSGKSTTAQFYEAGGGDYWHTTRITDWSDRRS